MIAHKKHSPGFLAIVNDAKTRIREVSVAEALKAINGGDARLIDVREDNEWAEGHAKGADHLGKGIIEHDNEMYGIGTVYLRLKGQVPPSTELQQQQRGGGAGRGGRGN